MYNKYIMCLQVAHYIRDTVFVLSDGLTVLLTENIVSQFPVNFVDRQKDINKRCCIQ